MFRANAIYEGEYLLGTSIARPLIARRLIEIANETGADASVIYVPPPYAADAILEAADAGARVERALGVALRVRFSVQSVLVLRRRGRRRFEGVSGVARQRWVHRRVQLSF